MIKKNKGFLFVSNRVLIFICLVGIGSLIFNIYMILDLDSSKYVIVDYVLYFKGTAEYEPIIKHLKQNFFASAAMSVLICSVTVVTLYIRRSKESVI